MCRYMIMIPMFFSGLSPSFLSTVEPLFGTPYLNLNHLCLTQYFIQVNSGFLKNDSPEVIEECIYYSYLHRCTYPYICGLWLW